MQRSQLNKIQNLYHTALGQIERDFELAPQSDPFNKKWTSYQLNVRTLFNGYQTFLTANEGPLEEKYFEFFRSITAKGAPEEVMVCAAAFLASKQGELKGAIPLQRIEEVCNDWGANLDEVLQFAVIGYLIDTSSLSKETWLTVIKSLLTLNLDPNYVSEKFKYYLPFHKWTLPIAELKSAFTILISTPNITDDIRELAVGFAAQQERAGSKLDLKPDEVEKLFPKVTKGFKSNPWFQWLEKNLPEKIKHYVTTRTVRLIMELAQLQDFESLDYLREKYKFNPFTTLMEEVTDNKCKINIIDNPIFHYLESAFKKEFFEYINNNLALFISKFHIAELADKADFVKIDQIRAHYQINPFACLIEKEKKESKGSCTNSPIFQYLETHFSEQLSEYLKTNNDAFLHRFPLKQLAAARDFKQIEQLQQHYGIDIFPALCIPANPNADWLEDPCIKYLFTKDFARTKRWLQSSHYLFNDMICKLAKSDQFDKIEIYRDTFEIDVYSILEYSLLSLKETPWVESTLFKYLEKHYPVRLAAAIKRGDYFRSDLEYNEDFISLEYLLKHYHFSMNIRNVMYVIDNDETMWEIICNHPLFLFLRTHIPNTIAEYFTKDYFSHIGKDPYYQVSKNLLNLDKETLHYLAYEHNIDPLFFQYKFKTKEPKPKLADTDKSFDAFYAERAKFVFAFIVQQDFPNARAKHLAKDKSAKEFSYKDKKSNKENKLIVSSTLHSILTKLASIIDYKSSLFNSASPHKLFQEVKKEATSAPKEYKSTDQAERDIYHGLESALSENSYPITAFVQREFDIYHRCIPVLKSLEFKESLLYNVSRETETFSKNALGLVFGFMGYGLKNKPEKQGQEAKEDGQLQKKTAR